jgi:hypothetical protein
MTDQERDNRELTEWMGECWHEYDPLNSGICCKCGKLEMYYKNLNFFNNPADWVRLWNRAKESKGLDEFLAKRVNGYIIRSTVTEYPDVYLINQRLIGPAFPAAWAEFLRDRKEEG